MSQTSPDAQRAAARNLVSALAVAWHGARKTGKPYSVTEQDSIGCLAGWVGLSSMAGLVAGHTTVCEVSPEATASEVVRTLLLVATERQLLDPQAKQILEEFIDRAAQEQVDGCGPQPPCRGPGKAPGVPEAQPEGGDGGFHIEGATETIGAKPGLLPGMGGP